ncbi:hypothetical protein [Acidithiobacillus ferrooxidans]|uniref:Uncharacterized protein n=1 Tax=Acidithiobacillus ferrooxidans TaxID=920 RepID=A0A2W1KT88_ACIFR|nr:hypothetical protein [Acidithiobacillus ferrooxidans]MBU2819400.1 hypothetical protein [Acidithiobacillus ferrooxidans]MCR1344063.1 hypothetical protein [Acidithiobacillus ferrooxidans]PZD82437.1 hypothetical protein DN052_05310 [Acidithiobacillus ferrooxidans]QLK41289.1 hypothetical protein FE661_03255 [Acidithiobacillus ferrooxidans]QZT53230.1 hypothetical protein K7B00_03250 [Acidithiobacillus ferrooxidans]
MEFGSGGEQQIELLESLGDVVEGLTVSISLSLGEVRGNTLSIAAPAVLKALLLAVDSQTVRNENDMTLDRYEEEGIPYTDIPVATTVADLTVAHVSPRNDDPDYRGARAAFAQERARELLDEQDAGPLKEFPAIHRDDLPEESRQRHTKISETNEAYLGKQAGVYTVRVPTPVGTEKEALDFLGIPDIPDQKRALLQLAFMADRRADLEDQAPLALVIDALSELLRRIREGMGKGVEDVFREVFAKGDPESYVLGQLDDEETGEPLDAWMVQWELPEKLVLAILTT